MLKYYFDCTVQDGKEIFKELKIMEQEEKYTSKLGYYPVIYITLKDVQDRNYENMLLNMKTAILDMYQEHRYLLDSEKIYPEEKEKIERLLKDEPIEVTINSETVIVGIEKKEDNIWGLLIRNRISKNSRNIRCYRRKISSRNSEL